MTQRISQKKRIIDLLKLKKIVTCPELMRLGIANHTARISELRNEGYKIHNNIQVKNGIKYSIYWMEQ